MRKKGEKVEREKDTFEYYMPEDLVHDGVAENDLHNHLQDQLVLERIFNTESAETEDQSVQLQDHPFQVLSRIQFIFSCISLKFISIIF